MALLERRVVLRNLNVPSEGAYSFGPDGAVGNWLGWLAEFDVYTKTPRTYGEKRPSIVLLLNAEECARLKVGQAYTWKLEVE